MKAAEKAKDLLERIDEISEDGFRSSSWEEILQIFEKRFGEFRVEFEENGSYDPSCYVRFKDNSYLYVGNPYQSAFSRFYIVGSKE